MESEASYPGGERVCVAGGGDATTVLWLKFEVRRLYGQWLTHEPKSWSH